MQSYGLRLKPPSKTAKNCIQNRLKQPNAPQIRQHWGNWEPADTAKAVAAHSAKAVAELAKAVAAHSAKAVAKAAKAVAPRHSRYPHGASLLRASCRAWGHGLARPAWIAANNGGIRHNGHGGTGGIVRTASRGRVCLAAIARRRVSLRPPSSPCPSLRARVSAGSRRCRFPPRGRCARSGRSAARRCALLATRCSCQPAATAHGRQSAQLPPIPPWP